MAATSMVLGGRYRLVRRIGAGGQAEVYEAFDEEVGMRIAVKRLLPAKVEDVEMLARLRREVLLSLRVTHANVARVFSFETEGQVSFITMEYLPGDTLLQRIAKLGCLSSDAALPIIEQIATGLAAAHRQGVLHRDLKPANVILTPDGNRERAVVTDFGLARPIRRNDLQSLTATGEVVGTPPYMAPEQLRGAALTSAADIYTLGVVMFEMVTGQLPFGSDPSMAAALKKLIDKAPHARHLVPDLPANWNAAIARCLRIAPRERFASALDVLAALDGRRGGPGSPLRRFRLPARG